MDWPSEDRHPEDRQPEDRLPEDRLPTDRLPTDRLPTDRLPTDRLPEERLPADRLPADRLPADRLPVDRLPTDRLPEERLPADRAALLALGAAAFLLRLPGLGRSLWYDELVTLSSFTASPWAAFTRQVAANNHPLASLLAWAAGAALPEGEAWLRLPFALVGALAAPALAWSGACAGARRAGLLGGALLALSPGAVLLSQQVRGYAPLLLCSALLPGLVCRTLAGAGRGTTLALAACVSLGLASHLTLALPLLLLTGLVAAAGPLRARASAAAQGQALLGLGGGWLLGLLLWAPILGRTVRWSAEALTGGDPGAGGESVGPAELVRLLGGAGPLGAALALLLLALLAAGLPRLLAPRRGGRARGGSGSDRSRVLGLVLLAPLLALGALFLAGAPAYPRLLCLGLPALLLLAGVGLSRLAPRTRAARGFLLVAAWSVVPLGAQAGRELQDLRGAARLARGLAGPQGTVAAEGFAGPLLRAYDPQVRPTLGPDEGELERLLSGDAPVVWIDPYPELTAPARRERLRQALGSPLVLPGSVSSVVVYRRGRNRE